MAVRLGRLTDSAYITERLAPMSYTVCAAPGYLARHGAPATPADLMRHDCLVTPVQEGSATWRFRDARGATEDVTVEARLAVSNATAALNCAAAGMGVVMLNSWYVAPKLASGELVRLLEGYQATTSSFDSAFWLVYPSRNYIPRKVRLFADFLKQHYRRGGMGEAVRG